MNPKRVPPSVSILFVSGPLDGQTFAIEKAVTILGREAPSDIIVADDPKVSRRHARLVWTGQQWRIENLSQSSFVKVDRKRAQQATLANGAVVNLGDTTAFVFVTGEATQPTPATPSASSAAASSAAASSAPFDAGETLAEAAPSADMSEPAPTILMQPPAAKAPVAKAPVAKAPTTSAPKPTRTTTTKTTAPPDDTIAPTPHADAATVNDDTQSWGDGQGTPAEATQLASLSTMGLPSIEITSTANGEKKRYMLTSPTVSIGRDATNDIVINDRIVSGKHLQIVRQGNILTLIHPHPDRDKTLNGLLYQGRKIRGDERFTKVLAKGDFFRIGDEHGALVTLTYNDGTGAAQTQPPTVKPIKLSAPELTIGRLPANDVVLDHPQVSAHHARLVRDSGGYRIVDLNSTNHVYVNGALVGDQALKMGDEIRIGPYRLVYDGSQLTQYDESQFIRIDALHLKKFGLNNVTLLDDITLAIPPRAFVALVGGSGAGKSTLMDALSGLRPAQQGEVLYNGQDYYKNLASYSTQLGYVPQDDIVHMDLTVERALYYAAKLRLPTDFTEEQIEQRIQEALADVELTERRGLLVRKLSGGQRKRVSIALELLANPSLFFLDEPTSGLDPGLDRKMMALLRNLADRGHTIVLVTHATTNINSCDYICFLAAGGRLAYFGPPEQAKTYFGKTDFAEIYSSLEATEDNPRIPAEAEARFYASPDYQEYVATPLKLERNGTGKRTAGRASAAVATPPAGADVAASPAAVPAVQRPSLLKQITVGWSQFTLLTMRYLELLRNDRINLLILLLQAPIIALLLVLMLRFEIGTGIFNAGTLVQCRTQILTSAGPLALPQAQHQELIGCQQALTFLKTSPNGVAYAKTQGGANQALQNFITPGTGFAAQQALFIMAFATILFGCLNGAREFVKESAIYRRERTVNLGIAPYMLSKIVVLGALCFFQSAVFVLLVELGEHFQQGIVLPPILEIYITLTLTALAGLMIGLAISAIVPNADRAISFVPIILLPQVVFSGAIIPLRDWLTQALAMIFPTRWAMVALGSIIGLHAQTVGGDRLLGNDYAYHGTLYSVYTQADALHRLLLAWGALAALIVALMVVIAIFLKRKDRRA